MHSRKTNSAPITRFVLKRSPVESADRQSDIFGKAIILSLTILQTQLRDRLGRRAEKHIEKWNLMLWHSSTSHQLSRFPINGHRVIKMCFIMWKQHLVRVFVLKINTIHGIMIVVCFIFGGPLMMCGLVCFADDCYTLKMRSRFALVVNWKIGVGV